MAFELKYFFFDLPLYSPIEINGENNNSFIRLLAVGVETGGRGRITIEGYNSVRKETSTFEGAANVSNGSNHFHQYGGIDRIILRCRRYEDEIHFFIRYDTATKSLMKVGQYPSIADIHIGQVKEYNKVLPKEQLKEFTRAIGLAANGVGIGSFVYLRRIFEHLIRECFDNHKGDIGLPEDKFTRLRMEEKIEALGKYLPSFLVDNRAMYSILSVGIHSLSEEECLEYFETIKSGIEIILDEKLAALSKEEKIAMAQASIASIKGKIKQ